MASGDKKTLVDLNSSQTLTNKTFTSPTFTGVQTNAAGSASTPSITTTSDTNTGIYFPAADTVAVATGGTERLRVGSTGNVGIGMSVPAEKLVVDGAIVVRDQAINWTSSDGAILDYVASTATGRLIATRTSTGNSNLQFHVYNSAVDITAMHINSSGNVLIGTTTVSTGAKLEVEGSISATGNIIPTSIYTYTGTISAGGSSTTTFKEFSNANENRVYLVVICQQGAAINTLLGHVITYGTSCVAVRASQSNESGGVLDMNLTSSGLNAQLVLGSGYSTTTWEYIITRIK